MMKEMVIMFKKKIYQVDAFTSTPFTGNPAGVVPDASGLTDQQMLKIAKEMNLSETAFVFPGSASYDVEVRFFTPTEEVDLCGHATIATFALLKELKQLQEDKIEFKQKTKAGILDIKLVDNHVVMRQADPHQVHKSLNLVSLCSAMNLQIQHMGLSLDQAQIDLIPEIWSTGLEDILLPVQSLQVLKGLTPDMKALSDLSRSLQVVGVHAFTIEEGVFWCRNFAPAFGIPEESATGTSNGALGAYLYHHHYSLGESLFFTINQGDWMDRPSRIRVDIIKNKTTEVWVGGQAVVVIEGDILVV